jgi:nitrogen fixation NifU-like protein
MSELYQEVILEEARHPQNQGRIPDADLVLQQTNASCGDQVTIYLKLDPHSRHITDIKWEGQGCIISQAAMSLVSQLILDQKLTVAQVLRYSQQDLEQLLGIEAISPGRIKCLLLGVSAFAQAQPVAKG